jgi:Putative amidase domain
MLVKRNSFTALLSVLMLLAASTATFAQSGPAEIAEAALIANNQLRVNGQVDPRLLKGRAGSSARAVIEGSIPEIVSTRDNMISNSLAYTGFQTKLTVKSLKVSGTAATLEGTEHTVLNLSLADVDPLAPKATEYDQDHIFTFTLRNRQWVLVSDRLINAFAPAKPVRGEVLIPQGSPSTSAEWTGEPAPEGNAPNVGFKDRLSSPMAVATAALNRTAIVNYAYTYARNYNSKYNNYDGQQAGGDCTNFVSQAMRAGGWTDVAGFYTLNYVWWFTSKWSYPSQSHTWINAHLWFTFISSRPRATLARNVRDLVPGDVLQADWDRDGRIDHSMIVTKKDSFGNIYLTYHSTNTVDKPFSSLPTNATYYGWRLYSYPN